MTDNEMEHLVATVLARLKKPVLLVLTAGTGYQQEIIDRLATLNMRFDMVMTEEATRRHCSTLWGQLATSLPDNFLYALPVHLPYSAVVVPFMEYPLATELVSGTLLSPVSKLLHHALISGIPTLALRYHCDPHSELNELRGLDKNPAYLQHIQQTLAQLQKYGLALCTMSEMIARLITSPEMPSAGCRNRYITVAELVNDPALVSHSASRFTDAAIDYLKEMKK